MSTIELTNCHHTIRFAENTPPPMIGEEVWCVRCTAMRKVLNAPAEFRVRCKRCPYSRRVGNARLTAEVRASKHAGKTGHPVAVYNGKKLIYVVGEKRAEQDTPLFGLGLTSGETSDPPF